MIKIDNITIAYENQTVQRNFSIAIPRSAKIAIKGPSGSGKSSILRTILGFITPTEGSITIDKVQLCPQTVWSLRKKIGYVPQEPDMGEGSARQTIEYPFSFHANHEIKKNLDNLQSYLDRFNLTRDILDKDITTLSGGEKQRIALIVALLLDRPILLLDEISSALDPECRQAVIDYLAQTDQTVVMVTHDPILQDICTNVIQLDNRKGDRQP